MLNEIRREPTPEELAERLGAPLEKVRNVLKVAKEPLSLETPVGDEEDSHLGDFIEDKNAVLPIDAAIQSNLREATTRALTWLTPRRRRCGGPDRRSLTRPAVHSLAHGFKDRGIDQSI